MPVVATGVVDILHIQVEAALKLVVGMHSLSSSLELVQIHHQLSQVLRQPPLASSSSIVRRLSGSLSASRRHLGLEELRMEVSIANRCTLRWTLTCHLCLISNVPTGSEGNNSPQSRRDLHG